MQTPEAAAAAVVTEPPGGMMLPTPTSEPSHRSAAMPARIRRPEAVYGGRCRGGPLPEQDHLGTLGGWAGWRGHTAGWSATPVTGPTRTSDASVSGCASAAAKSPTSRSTRGPRSSTSQTSGASRSADVTGAVRLSHASCMNGVRGSMSVRSNTSASATPAIAVARRNTPATYPASVDRLECPRFDGHLSAGSVGARPEDVHRGCWLKTTMAPPARRQYRAARLRGDGPRPVIV